MTSSKLASITLALLLTPGLLVAQDVTGLWDIQASFTLPDTDLVTPCEYSGKGISLAQNGVSVSGKVDLNLNGGPPECPGAIISGTLEATLRGASFAGTLTGSQLLGTATVNGSVATDAKGSSAAAAATTTMKGTATVSGGSFSGSGGSFGGQQLPIAPTLGPAAIGLLALILFGGTILLLMRRDRVSL